MSKKRMPSGVGNAQNLFGMLPLLALIAVALAPAPVLAQQQGTGGESGTGVVLPSGGWYGGLSTGRFQLGIRNGILPATGVTLSNLFKDESGSGYKLYGGYQFNRSFALEGGYADSGRFDAQREVAPPMPGSISSGISTSGFYLGAVAVVPLPSRFSLFGKLGTGYTTSTVSISASGAMLPLLTPADLGRKRSEWSSKYGLGASYEMSNKLGLRFEYERINSASDGRIGEANAGVWSLGLTKRY